jgi:hypothetical protein
MTAIAKELLVQKRPFKQRSLTDALARDGNRNRLQSSHYTLACAAARTTKSRRMWNDGAWATSAKYTKPFCGFQDLWRAGGWQANELLYWTAFVFFY